jgi:uncharacterized protein YndB with AHSA1/START domain
MEEGLAHSNDTKTVARPEPLVITRSFSAPREQVFRAWSSAERMKRWFSPAGFTVPEAEIDFRPGGEFAVCMRSPEGQQFWSRGTYIEISAPDRLVFSSDAVVDGSKKFTAHTTINFEDEGAGTRMTVRQGYDIHDERFLSAVEGAPEGWRTTLDKLQQEVGRTQPSGSVVHATFTVERIYNATPAEVFHALSDKNAKARWFEGGEGYTVLERDMDFRPDGREHLKGRWENGRVSTFDAAYFDIVPNERIVYAYEMSLDDRKISVSLATIELTPTQTGTRLVLTEQGAFLDGYDDGGSRERGTNYLFDRLGESLRR